MNKQEAIEKINELKELSHGALGADWIELGIDKALDVVKQLDDVVKPPKSKSLVPENPVVPKYVADFYESIKYDFEWGLYKLCVKFHENKLRSDLHAWFNDNNNKCIETLVKMKLFGYEIEKEKLYKVSLKKNGLGIGIQKQDGSFKEKFTKTELSEYDFNDLDVYEVKEVE